MKAVRIHQFGGPEVLTYEDIPDPQPRKDQVLVRVQACSLNHLDVWVRKGLPGVKLPHILGSDIAGEIVEVGEYVTGFKAGQRVLLAPMHFCGHCVKCVAGLQNQCREFTVLGNAVDGGNCELIAVPAANVIPIPDSLDFNQAASVPLVFVTAWHMLVGRAGIRPGQTVLVLGASSGVGIAAIQIAKLFHCRVITTAGDETKLAEGTRARRRLRHQSLPAENFRRSSQDHEQRRRRHRDRARRRRDLGRKRALAQERRHAGHLRRDHRAERRPSICGILFARQLTLLGSYMGTMGELHEVLGHVFAGRLKPVVDRVFPLSEIRAAHEYLEKSQMFGKIVVTP